MTGSHDRAVRPFWTICCAAAVGLAAVSSCYLPDEPLPSGSIAFFPPAIYRTWWNEVEACSGVTGNFDAIVWYDVPDASVFRVGSDSNIEGYWQPYHHSITLAGLRVNDPFLVRHEELHAILHTVDHPAQYFVQKCGSMVA